MKKTSFANFSEHNLVYTHYKYLSPEKNYFVNHNHQMAEVLLIASDNASFVINGRGYSLKKNDLIFINSNVWHYLKFLDIQEYERYNIMFDVSILPPSLKKCIEDEYKILSLNDGSLLTQLFLKLDRYVNDFENEDCHIILRQIVIEMIYNITAEKGNTYTGSPDINNVMENIINYINQNLTEIKSIEQICSNLFISKSYLHKLFNKYMRISPKKYITDRRLLLARQMLISGEKPLKIYTNCGFSDYTSFYRAYKKQFGISPTNKQ